MNMIIVAVLVLHTKICLQFTQAKHEEMAKKVDIHEKKTSANEQSVIQSFDYIEAIEDNEGYMENRNWRNNIKKFANGRRPIQRKSWINHY